MEVKAKIGQLRIAPRKVRLVSDYLKGMDAMRAKDQLQHLAKRTAKPLAKLIDSAMANAHNNFGLVKENLYIKKIIVDEGVKLKRFRPKGFGSTSPIEKKTSHIKIILDERVPGMKAEPKSKEKPTQSQPASGGEIRHENEEQKIILPEKEKKAMALKAREARETKKKGVFGGIKNLGRKFFRRKAI